MINYQDYLKENGVIVQVGSYDGYDVGQCVFGAGDKICIRTEK